MTLLDFARWTSSGLLLCVLTGGAGNAAEPGPAAPAHVAKPGKEADLATLTLTPEAVRRLGIATAVVE